MKIDFVTVDQNCFTRYKHNFINAHGPKRKCFYMI